MCSNVKSLKVLCLGKIIPLPLNSGERIYTAALAAAIANAGARTKFLGLKNPESEVGGGELSSCVEWKTIAGQPNPLWRSLLSLLPLNGARFATSAFKRDLRLEMRDGAYDAVVFDQYSISWALDLIVNAASNRPVIVYVAHNFEAEVTRQIAKNYKGDLLRKLALTLNHLKTVAAERRLTREADILVTLTDEDRKSIALYARPVQRLKALVLRPGHVGTTNAERMITADTPRKVLIVGSFAWIAKQMNVESLLSVGYEGFVSAGITIDIIGYIPDLVLDRWRRRFPHVNFRGFVDDLLEEFSSARIALIPEETGGGFKLKTLDYIFGRIPVAAIKSGLGGIPDEVSRHFLVSDSIPELIDSVLQNIDNVSLLQRLHQSAFMAAKGRFDWQRNGALLVQAITEKRNDDTYRTRVAPDKSPAKLD
jgi:glycosyltransferase involved in cell wall biosynthesis